MIVNQSAGSPDEGASVIRSPAPAMQTGRTDAEKAAEQTRIALQYQMDTQKGRQKQHGVVVTPVEIVDSIVRSTIEQIRAKGRAPDEGVEWLDPFAGTGIFIARLLQIVDLPPARKLALADNCVVVEIDPVAAQICANNLFAVVREETGRGMPIRVICTDTFTLPPDADLWAPRLPVVRPNLTDWG